MDPTESSTVSAIRLGADLSDLLSGVESRDLSTVVESALERIADEVDADIAFAALLAGDEVEHVWEWTGPGVEQSDPPRPGQSRAEAFELALVFLEADEACPIADLSQLELSPEQRERFALTRVEALLLVPVCSHGHLVGVTGFLTVGRTREWTQRHIDTLRRFSRVLVTAALRSRSGASAAAATIRATRIASFIPEGLVTSTTDGVITWASPRVVELLGRDPSSLAGLPLSALAPDFEAELKELQDTVASGTEAGALSLQVPSRDQGLRWCELTMTLAGEGVSDPTAELLVVLRDVHHRQQAFVELEHAASHDSLTGALNRWGLRAAYDATMSTARSAFMALVDVDEFKSINDEFGHLVGDRILVDVAAALHDLAGDEGLVARLGGDEFVFLSPAVLSAARAESLCAQMCERLHVPTGGDRHTTASIGAILATQPTELGDLLAHADQAVYRAKAGGRDRWLLQQIPASRGS